MLHQTNAELLPFKLPASFVKSYWIILVYTTTNSRAENLLKEMDFWMNYIVKREAVGLCLEPADGDYFTHYLNKFGTSACPEIIIAADKSFTEFVKIKHELINKLMETPKSLQEFCIQIHTMITSGITIREIEKKLRTKAFWQGLNLVYKEVRSLISFSIKFGN